MSAGRGRPLPPLSGRGSGISALDSPGESQRIWHAMHAGRSMNMNIRYRVEGPGFTMEIQGSDRKLDSVVQAIAGAVLGIDDSITITRINLKAPGL